MEEAEKHEVESSLDADEAKLSLKVIIMSVDGQLTSYKTVLDYAMRPGALYKVCLYEFIQQFKKFKVSQKKASKDNSSDKEDVTKPGNTTNFSFLPDHPQFKTHKISWLQKEYGHIPNFIGGTLPRQDKGDQDYYCCTMLVLFKPWRNSADLKALDITWCEAFDQHDFSEAQHTSMDCFQIRHECNEARDDFQATLEA